MPAPAIRKHTDALVQALKDSGGITVADGDAGDLEAPYVVVYRIPGGDSYGTLADLNEDAELIYQVTCVGLNRAQAEWLVDKVTDVVLLTGFTVTGRTIAQVTVEDYAGVIVDREVDPHLFTATPRYRIFTTPS